MPRLFLSRNVEDANARTGWSSCWGQGSRSAGASGAGPSINTTEPLCSLCCGLGLPRRPRSTLPGSRGEAQPAVTVVTVVTVVTFALTTSRRRGEAMRGLMAGAQTALLSPVSLASPFGAPRLGAARALIAGQGGSEQEALQLHFPAADLGFSYGGPSGGGERGGKHATSQKRREISVKSGFRSGY
jgi:hypothetical protein